MARRYWTLRDWPIAVEASSALDAFSKMTKALLDISTRIKAGEKIIDLFSSRVIRIEETEGKKVVTSHASNDASDKPTEQQKELDPKKGWDVN